jgi:flagellar basal body-associated protein FliL
MADDHTVDHTIIVETPERSGGGSGWIIALVLIVALVIGVVFFSRMSGSEAVKDNAVANAANNVGAAAKDVGDAAQDAVHGAK